MKKTIFLLILLFFVKFIFAKYISTYEFLNIQETGNIAISSLAGISTSDDLFAIYGNPAPFANYHFKKGVIFSDVENIMDTRKFGVVYGQKLQSINFAVGVDYFYVKDAPQVNFNAYSAKALIALSPFKIFQFGATLRYSQSSIAQYKASLISMDIGFYYSFYVPFVGVSKVKNLSLGLYADNLGLPISQYSANEPLNYNLNSGVKYQFLNLSFLSSALLLNYRFNQYNNWISGAMNIGFLRMLKISGAYQFNSTTNPLFFSLGLQHKFQNIQYTFNSTVKLISNFSPVFSISFTIEK